MNHAYLLTGGNLGDRAENLKKAAELIGQQAGRVLQISSLYQTAAWGKTAQPDYLNQAIEIETELSAPALLAGVLDIERQMGRIRQEKYGARIIDIDILFFNGDIIKLENLSIPHPHLQNRRFVLVPLAEIAPGYQHPVLKQTTAQLLGTCPDTLDVKKFYPE